MLIDNRYHVLGPLGQGAMGEVVLAEDLLRGGLRVALKRLRLHDRGALDRFRREFLVLSALRHPHVARVHDFGTIRPPPGSPAPGHPEVYFTSEHVPGRELLEAARGLALAEVVELFAQLCRGLAYIHARGVVHGDLKPANVLVVEREGAPPLVKLIDFGLAVEALAEPAPIARGGAAGEAGREAAGEAAGEAGRAVRAAGEGAGERAGSPDRALAALDGRLRGTPRYLAPEVIAGRAPDARADLYALGVTLFEVLTGAPLFEGSAREVLDKQLHARPRRPSSLRADLPPELDLLALALLEKDPRARPPSAGQVIEALGRVTGAAYELETEAGRAAYALAGRLIGRDDERRRLERALERRARPLVEVSGAAGIGKSRLVAEARATLQLGGVEVIDTRCDADALYGPLADAVARLWRLVQPEEAALLGASRALVLAFAGLDDDAAGAPAPAPAPPAAARAAARAGPPPEPGDVGRARIVDAVTTFLLAAAWRRPLVLIIEDLHRADLATLELLAHLVRTLGAAERARAGRGDGLAEQAARASGAPPLAIAATLRPDELAGAAAERLAALDADGLVERIEVLPLDEGGTRALLRSMLGADEVDGALAARVHRETGGNPFFIEEVVRALVEQGGPPVAAPRASSGRLRAVVLRPRDLEGLAAPRGVADVLRARLAHTEPAERAVLEALAAAGRAQPVPVLAAATGFTDDDVTDRLAALERRGLVELRTGKRGGVRYGLVHEMLGQVALADLPAGARARLFFAVGEAVEQAMARGEVYGDFALLAACFREAEKWARTFHHARIAANEAAALHANERALELYRWAAAAAARGGAGPVEAADALEREGGVRERLGDLAGAIACYRGALAALAPAGEPEGAGAAPAAGAAPPPGAQPSAGAEPVVAAEAGAGELARERARLHRRLGDALGQAGEGEAALAALGDGLRALGDRLDGADAARLFASSAAVLVKLGRLDRALDTAVRALALTAPGSAERALCLNIEGVALAGRGALRDALGRFEESLAIRERLEEPEAISRTLLNLGAVTSELGQHGRAVPCFERALALAERMGDRAGAAEVAAQLGGARLALGEHDRARASFELALERAEGHGDPAAIVHALARLARCDTERGAYRDAWRWLERAGELALRPLEGAARARERLERARFLLAVGAFDEAAEALREAAALAEVRALAREAAEALTLEAALARERGAPERAERPAAEASARYERLGSRAEAALAGIELAAGLVERAHAELDAAGASPTAELAHAAIAGLEARVEELRAGRLYAPLALVAGHARLLDARLDAEEAGEAALALEEARRLARDDQRPELAWRADHRLAEAALAGRAPARALKACVRAMEAVQVLYDRVPPRFAAAYLAAPARQALRATFARARAAAGQRP